MSQKFRIIHLLLFAAALAGLSFSLSGSFAIPTGDTAIWLHSGLLMIIIGMYWIEPFFTKPSDAVINGLVVFVSVSTLSNPPNAEWWTLLRYFSLFLVIIAFLVIWAGTPALAQNDTSKLKKVLYLTVIRLGNSKVLFSLVFVLALISYLDLQRVETRLLVIFWGVLLSAKHLDVEGLIDFLLQWKLTKLPQAIGEISRVAEPNIVRFRLKDNAVCTRGSLVAFTENGIFDSSCPIGLIIGHRSSPGTVEAEAILIDSSFEEGSPDQRNTVTKLDTEQTAVMERLNGNAYYKKISSLIGFASRGSEISRLYFELMNKSPIEEGHLVSVPLVEGKDLLFQIVNGKLCEESSIESSERSFTIGEAEQLGTWNQGRQGFETHSWVVPENSPVFHVSPSTEVTSVLRGKILEIGKIPNSSFPVKISVQDLTLFHSALLGVTGSGKSFLAYHLIEKCAQEGIKVICFDITGDHKRYLQNPVLLKNAAGVKEFLESTTYCIGIFEFLDRSVHPITATKNIADQALQWAERNRRPEEVTEPVPKVLLVLEEAHTLIPEWNSNPERGLQDVVNRTSQIALQARKYGLGFMIITQRTANVTKSILNQCNTIIAFQAYDETGFEFMKNYMGDHYVRALPNLKKRHGVLVGKASLSDRPLILRFQDQGRTPTSTPIPELPASVPAASTVTTP